MPAARRRLRRAAGVLAAGAVAAAPGALALPQPPPASPATAPRAGGIPLPAPVRNVDPLKNPGLHLRKDRLLTSTVPGQVRNREDVTVAVGPDGIPETVTDLQHLLITGAGNYVVRELGPARAAEGLGDTVPPVLELGTVVWQGFSPGRRALAARLTLDPGIEAARLPLAVGLRFRPADGRARPLAPGARAPVDGTVTVTLVNQTAGPRPVATGVADAGPLASALDRLRRAAGSPREAVPPTAGAGLPRAVPGRVAGTDTVSVVAPLRVTGTIRVPGATVSVSGPGTTPVADGVAIAGTLDAQVSFDVPLRAGRRLALDLHVRPWLDPRTLAPPAPSRTWRAWAATGPGEQARAAATGTLLNAAAAAARSAEYSPYLQADTPGTQLSTFRYVVAAAPAAPRAARTLHANAGAVAATLLAAGAIVGNAALLRRRL